MAQRGEPSLSVGVEGGGWGGSGWVGGAAADGAGVVVSVELVGWYRVLAAWRMAVITAMNRPHVKGRRVDPAGI
jgi:hypothetical protein